MKRIDQIRQFTKYVSALQSLTAEERLEFLKKLPHVQRYLSQNEFLDIYLRGLNSDCAVSLLSIVAIGQEDQVFNKFQKQKVVDYELLRQMSEQLITVEQFYDFCGGVIGYYLEVLKKLEDSDGQKSLEKNVFHPSDAIYLNSTDNPLEKQCQWGIEALEEMIEIYPLGGAGDRFDLKNSQTGESLPVASLNFMGRSLLEGLIRDLEAREALFFKTTGKKVCVPIVMMTSSEKKNHTRILDMLKSHDWFGRNKDHFFLFSQSSVPLIDQNTNWVMEDEFRLKLKPGGHGALWKYAHDSGMFEWAASKGKKYALIRQINNPMAGEGNTLLAFMGIGAHHNKTFGFIGCSKRLGAAEGMIVLEKKKTSSTLKNIEYTEFKQCGIDETARAEGSPYSRFPANTNILFIHLEKVKQLTKKTPCPGFILNLKNNALPWNSQTQKTQNIPAGRLEGTMQSIAELLSFSSKEEQESFLVYQAREKVFSVTKKQYREGKSAEDTPVTAFYQLQASWYDQMRQKGGELPLFPTTLESFLEKGLPVVFDIHPAFWCFLSEKLDKVKILNGSLLKVDVADVCFSEFKLCGGLIIEGDSLVSSNEASQCILQNVEIHLAGRPLDDFPKDLWKMSIAKENCVHIKIHGNGSLRIKNVCFTKPIIIEVPDQTCVEVTQEGEEIIETVKKAQVFESSSRGT